MKYRFEIVSSPSSKYHVCASCVFQEEAASPLLYLNEYANDHFGRLGLDSLGDQLDLHRDKLCEAEVSCETWLCSAAFVLIDGVPTIRMIAGPLMKQELAALAKAEAQSA